MGVERRGRVIEMCSREQPGSSREESSGQAALLDKSFEISKQQVWEAYRRVAANKGAARADGMSIADFETDLI